MYYLIVNAGRVVALSQIATPETSLQAFSAEELTQVGFTLTEGEVVQVAENEYFLYDATLQRLTAGTDFKQLQLDLETNLYQSMLYSNLQGFKTTLNTSMVTCSCEAEQLTQLLVAQGSGVDPVEVVLEQQVHSISRTRLVTLLEEVYRFTLGNHLNYLKLLHQVQAATTSAELTSIQW